MLVDELELLLAQDPAAVRDSERRAFDASEVVLFGAGALGRQTLKGLRKIGIEPLAFSDNNPAAWNTAVDGIMVLPPPEAARRFGKSATFVVTIWRAGGKHRFAHFREQLHALGCGRVESFGVVFWKYAEVFLPHYAVDLPHHVIDEREAVRDCLDLWGDEESQREYVAQIRWRLLLDFDGLPSPAIGEQYFPPGLFSWRNDETFVDCGAFDGDTLRGIIVREGDRFCRLIALEPDPANFTRLSAFRDSLAVTTSEKIRLLELAAASRAETVRFDATGTASSTMGAGGIEVKCAPLDEVLADELPTFIKMDIEGAEPDALIGTRQTIARHRPLLAICVYHRQNHLWRIPLWIKSASKDYRFFLRPHNEECWDTVCYAIPRERVKKP